MTDIMALMGAKRTEQETAALRARMVDLLVGFDEFTCDTCVLKHRCKLAFDPYNTDGDCLAEK